MPAASLRALLAQSIDYAGLFPPAELALEPALREHAAYLRSPDRWMLGGFVLPVGKFSDAAKHFPLFDAQHVLEISALGPKTANSAEFAEALEKIGSALEDFRAQAKDVAVVRQLEIPLPAAGSLDSLGKVASVKGELPAQIFLEAPPNDAAQTIVALASRGLGFKLRTGGVTADAFPSGAQIARALVAAAQQRVPIKFTAGLHHPVRLFHASVQTKMHGFLNVLGAGVLAAEHRWDEAQTEEMLRDEDAKSFRGDDDFFCWRDWKISTTQIAAQRKLITSLGSCSFDEPRDDLRALGLF